MKNKKDKCCLNVRSTHIIKIILICIITLLILSCFSEWYPIYDDWLCTINIDGTDLNYVRNSYGYLMLSPDRTKLIEFSNQKFYSVNINDLSYRVLIHDFGDSSYVHSPAIYNGQILFVELGDMYSFDLENYNITRLTNSGSCRNPELSEDGSKIAYSTTIWDSLASLKIMNSDGTNPQTILEYSTSDTAYTYSSYIIIRNIHFVMEDQVILYSLSSSINIEIQEGIYSINIDGSNNRCLVEEGYVPYLTISPERDFMLFNDSGNIYKMNTDGTNYISICDSVNYDFDPSISPDGEKILFASGGYPYIMNAEGSDKYQIVDIRVEGFSHNNFLDNYKVLLLLEKQIN